MDAGGAHDASTGGHDASAGGGTQTEGGPGAGGGDPGVPDGSVDTGAPTGGDGGCSMAQAGENGLGTFVAGVVAVVFTRRRRRAQARRAA
jgi:MYXO-CTERM domain-containing protein